VSFLLNPSRHVQPPLELPDHNWVVNYDATLDVYVDAGVTPATQNNDYLQEWHDQTGVHDATQTNASFMLRYLTSASWNGIASVDGSIGGNRYMNVAGGDIPISNGYTFFAVLYRYTDNLISIPLGGSDNTRNYPLLWASNGQIYFSMPDTSAYSTNLLVGEATGNFLVCVQAETNGNALLKLNRYVEGTHADLNFFPADGLTPTDITYLGRRSNTHHYQDQMSQILFTEKILSATEIQDVEYYLHTRWGF